MTLLLTYLAACILLALTPGPNMSLIIANTLAGGMRAGFTTLAGTGTGLVILVAIASVGMSSVMVLMADWFDVVRWAGAVYLVFLGTRQLWGWWRRRGGLSFDSLKVSTASTYMQGLLVSISNPKSLLFLGAFFPQFVDPSGDPMLQLTTLAVLLVVTLVVVDCLYTFAVGRARQAIDARKLAALDGLAGGLLVAGGLVLATARRP